MIAPEECATCKFEENLSISWVRRVSATGGARSGKSSSFELVRG